MRSDREVVRPVLLHRRTGVQQRRDQSDALLLSRGIGPVRGGLLCQRRGLSQPQTEPLRLPARHDALRDGEQANLLPGRDHVCGSNLLGTVRQLRARHLRRRAE